MFLKKCTSANYSFSQVEVRTVEVEEISRNLSETLAQVMIDFLVVITAYYQRIQLKTVCG